MAKGRFVSLSADESIFCEHVASGVSCTEAARRTWPERCEALSESYLRTLGHRIMLRPAVINRVRQLEQAHAKAALDIGMDVGSMIQLAFQTAHHQHNASVMLDAANSLANITGLTKANHKQVDLQYLKAVRALDVGDDASISVVDPLTGIEQKQK
jgi:hypothetical protein